MQCPSCGHDGIAEEARFCPHCRHLFRVPEPGVDFDNSMLYEPEPVTGYTIDNVSFIHVGARQIQVQLLQPALLVMISSAVILYLASDQIAGLAIMVSTVEIRVGAFLCFLIGAIIGWIFYRIVLNRIE